jgi:hypothetical protein
MECGKQEVIVLEAAVSIRAGEIGGTLAVESLMIPWDDWVSNLTLNHLNH